jgi:hypothetical protein
MSIDDRLKQAAEAVEQSVQDVNVVARLHELPKRQRARQIRAGITALAVFAAVLIPMIVPLGRDATTSNPVASQTTLRSADGVTVQVLNGTIETGLASRLSPRVRAAGYDVVAANTALGSFSSSRVYYTPGHRADAEAFRDRFPAFSRVEPAPANLSDRVALHVVIGRDYTEPTTGACGFPPLLLGC